MHWVKYFFLLICCYSVLGTCPAITSGSASGKSSGFRKPKNGNVYVIAHRGAHENGIPENSLAAYRKAIDIGCDFVEVDIRTTKDGKFVSMHNPDVASYVRGKTGKVRDLTLDEIESLDIGLKVGETWKGTRVPTFEQILRLCKGKIGIYLDLKDAPVSELMKIIRKYGMEQDVVWYLSPGYAGTLQDNPRIFGNSFPMPDPQSVNNIDHVAAVYNARVVATDMGVLSKSFVRKAHQKHAMVFVDDEKETPEEWKHILELETDGIQTDKPEELIRFIKSGDF